MHGKNNEFKKPLSIIRSVGLEIRPFQLEFISTIILNYLLLCWIVNLVEKRIDLGNTIMDLFSCIDSINLVSENMVIPIVAILQNDAYLTKGVRMQLNSIFIKCALPYPDLKLRLAIIYSDLYPNMLSHYLTMIREPEHSLVHFSVQIFTTSSIMLRILTSSTFYTEYCQVVGKFLRSINDKSNPAMDSRRLSSSVAMALSVFHYVFNDPKIKEAEVFGCPNNVNIWVEHVLSAIEQCHQQQRQVDTHVLYESQEWSIAFTTTLQINELTDILVKNIPDSKVNSILDGLRSKQDLLTTLRSFDDLVSLHQPITCFFALLLRKAFDVGPKKFLPIISSFPKHFWSKMSIKTLKPLIAAYEMDAGLWVRNGLIMKHQVSCPHLSPFNDFRPTSSCIYNIALFSLMDL